MQRYLYELHYLSSTRLTSPPQMQDKCCNNEHNKSARWNATRDRYACTGDAKVGVGRDVFEYFEEEHKDRGGLTTPRNGIAYRKDGRTLRTQLFVSEMELSRDALLVAQGANRVRTITFPKTIRDVTENAFYELSFLRSAVMNEGLEALGERGGTQSEPYSGAFRGIGLQRVVFPSTIKSLGTYTFRNCKDLKRVIFRG